MELCLRAWITSCHAERPMVGSCCQPSCALAGPARFVCRRSGVRGAQELFQSDRFGDFVLEHLLSPNDVHRVESGTLVGVFRDPDNVKAAESHVTSDQPALMRGADLR